MTSFVYDGEVSRVTQESGLGLFITYRLVYYSFS